MIRRLLGVLLVLVLAAPAFGAESSEPAEPADEPLSIDLALLVAEAETFPQDYSVAVRLALGAFAEGRWELSLEAWDKALQLSGGNVDVALGRSLLFLEMDRVVDARAEARAATELSPDAPLAWTRRAWAQRHPARAAAGTWGQLAALASYREALRLSPDDPLARCGQAWTTMTLGDRLGASGRFVTLLQADPSDDCAREGALATQPRLAFGGAVAASGLLYDGHATNQGGLSVLFQGGLEVADLAFFQVSGRLMRTWRDGETVDDYEQQELWARLGLAHAGFGGQVLGTVLRGSASDGTTGIVSGQVWGGAGVTLRGEGSAGAYPDGTAAMGGVGVRVPVLSFLRIDARVRLSSWHPTTPTDLPPGAPVSPADEGPFANLQASALLSLGPLDLEVGGRYGPEVRPIRFDEPTAWNLVDRPTAGVFASGRIAFSDNLGLTFGYEALRLRPPDDTESYHTHVLTLGVYAEGTGGLNR